MGCQADPGRQGRLPAAALSQPGVEQVLRNVAHDMGESGLYDSWSQAQPASPSNSAGAPPEAERGALESQPSRGILESHASRMLSPIAEAEAVCADEPELRAAASEPAGLPVGAGSACQPGCVLDGVEALPLVTAEARCMLGLEG